MKELLYKKICQYHVIVKTFDHDSSMRDLALANKSSRNKLLIIVVEKYVVKNI